MFEVVSSTVSGTGKARRRLKMGRSRSRSLSRSRSPRRHHHHHSSSRHRRSPSPRESYSRLKVRPRDLSRRDRRRSVSWSSQDSHGSLHRARHDSGSRRPRFRDGRDCPSPCNILGVFGMHPRTDETHLTDVFGKYGHVENVKIVRDSRGESRCFGFVYFETVTDASKALNALKDAEIDGCTVRVDYSVTRFGGPGRHRYREEARAHYPSRRSISPIRR